MGSCSGCIEIQQPFFLVNYCSLSKSLNALDINKMRQMWKIIESIVKNIFNFITNEAVPRILIKVGLSMENLLFACTACCNCLFEYQIKYSHPKKACAPSAVELVFVVCPMLFSLEHKTRWWMRLVARARLVYCSWNHILTWTKRTSGSSVYQISRHFRTCVIITSSACNKCLHSPFL